MYVYVIWYLVVCRLVWGGACRVVWKGRSLLRQSPSIDAGDGEGKSASICGDVLSVYGWFD